MSEVFADEEEWEDEGEDYDPLEDELDALEARLDEQESLAEVQAQIAALERAHGSRFSQEEVQQIGELIDQGYTPESVYEAVAPTSPEEQAFGNQFERTLARVEHEQGRELQQSEVDNLYRQAEQLDDPTHIEPEAVRDLGTRKGRIAHIDERLAEPAETPETVELPGEDSTPRERIEYMNARVSGAEVDTYEGDE